jgi:hypothetical protein
VVSLPLENAIVALILAMAVVSGITFIVYGIKYRAGHRFWDMIREKDFHPSISRLQFLLWTWVVAFVFAAIFFIRAWAGVSPVTPEIPQNVLLLMGVSAAPPVISSGINVTRYSAGIQRARNAVATFKGIKSLRDEFKRNGATLQKATKDARVLAEQSAAVASRDTSIAEFTVARAQAAQQAAQFTAQAAMFGLAPAQNRAALISEEATKLGKLAVDAQEAARQSKTTAITNELAARVAADQEIPNPDIPLSDIFNEDGKPAVTRFQMFVWTFISIIAYFVIFGMTLNSMVAMPNLEGVENLALPNIHETLLALMGISQGAYVAGKMARST